MIKKVQNTVPSTFIINDFNGEEIVDTFYNKIAKRQIKQNLEKKKYSREKVINYMPNGKVMKIHLVVVLTKNIVLYKMSYFLESYTRS